MSVGFCTSPIFLRHRTGPDHPERPERLLAIAKAVRDAGVIDSPNNMGPCDTALSLKPIGGPKLIEIAPAPASIDDLRQIHDPRQIEHVRRLCASGGGILDQADTPVGPESFDVALLAAGAVITCCDAVMRGDVQRAFAAVRPPGHHAEPDHSMGFCLFANVAIAARHLQHSWGLGRIAIVDFDVHHGNGTQAAFESDPSILFISLHQHPRTCYPGTGFDWERGRDAGLGFTLNIPLPPGTGDDDYLAAVDQLVLPRIDEFQPDFVLLSAGFDAHAEDPLAQLELSEEGFYQLTRRLTGAAERHCGGRLVSALEGGYNLRALARSVVRHLAALRDTSGPSPSTLGEVG
jgi:acetoin utilization deacetylase AcuC-like enzyme